FVCSISIACTFTTRSEIFTLSLHDTLPISETSQWIILDCDSCGIPMAVWRAHTEDIPEEQKTAMLAELARIADIHLGAGRWRLEIGRAHVSTPVTFRSRIPSSA